MKSKGFVLSKSDANIESQAKRAGLGVVVDKGRPFSFEKTLFVEAGTRIPWDLLPAAWHFLERWDAAVPLWRYGVTAEDVGSSEDRHKTKLIVRDLRVLLHSCELLFIRHNKEGQALHETWIQEMSDGGDKRLAFLRALYMVKPRLCILPVTWLAEVRHQSNQTLMRQIRSINAGKPLVRVELEPGRFVKCHQGDEERVLAHFQRQKGINR